MRTLLAAWLLTNRLAQPPDMLTVSMRSSGECVERVDGSFYDLLCEASQAQDGTTRQGFALGRYAQRTSGAFLLAPRYSTVTLTAGYRVETALAASVARMPRAKPTERTGRMERADESRDEITAMKRIGTFDRS